ncbi:MAG: transposase [Deltaproteobacteria bacterium]|nr:transposase [Deltaproteobacteria bacterium]
MKAAKPEDGLLDDLQITGRENLVSNLLFTRALRQLLLLKEKKYAGRKTARPISTRHYNHVVLKARRPILRKNSVVVRALIRETQLRFGVRLRALAVMPDHVHLIVQVGAREQFQDALRFLAGMIALKVAHGKLWLKRAWSRVVRSGRDQWNAEMYVCQNPFRTGIFTEADHAMIQGGVLLAGTCGLALLRNSEPQ